MKAKDISGQAPGGKRERLADKIPLATPFVIQVFPIYACNFKCSYCIFSVEKEKRGFISDKVSLDLELYKKAVDDMRDFPDRVKVIRFVGIGEPLLHKDLFEMIRYTKEKNVTNIVELLTNASLLSNENSDKLIEAGIDRVVVSIQGTDTQAYKEISKVDIEFDTFIENLRYFHQNKGEDKQLYIKVVDTALKDDDDKEKFYSLYGEVCDTIAIEHTVPIHDSVDYTGIINEAEEVTQFGLPVKKVSVCPQPFFHMQINPDGKIVPCYSWDYPEIIGNIKEESLVDIWNGENFNAFRKRMLEWAPNASAVCDNCNIIKYRLFPEDDLSEDAQRLMKFYD